MAGQNLRSPLLRTYHEWADNRWPVVARRVVIVGIALAGVALVAAGLWFRVLSHETGYVLYWLHDHVLLPFLGYTWTWSYPYSLVWWLPTAVLFLLWLVTFTSRHSIIRRPHVWLCGAVIERLMAASPRSALYTRVLLAFVDLLGRYRLECDLLRDVATVKHTDALIEVVRDATNTPEPYRRLVRLTNLVVSLESRARATRPQIWWAFATWHQCLRWLDRGYDRGRDADEFAKLLELLTSTRRRLTGRLEGPADDFAAAIVCDVDCLTASVATNRNGAAFDTALSSIAAREDQIVDLLENVGADWRVRGTPVAPLSDADEQIREAQGVLTISVALHAALRGHDAALAIAGLNTIDALRFSALLRDDDDATCVFARQFTRGAPQREHYRFAYEVASAARRRIARTPGLSPDALAEALQNEETLLALLNDASGPDFAAGGSVADVRANDVASMWQTRRGTRAWQQQRVAKRPVPLRLRTDPILIGGAACAGVATMIVLALAIAAASIDWHPWRHRALADYRILDNVRRDLPQRPLHDAVFHAPDGEIVVSQAGGAVHSYHPGRGIWSTARPFTQAELVNPDIRWLTSPDGDGEGGLWGVTAGGGLVRRERGRWDVVIGDSRFAGLDGKPVQQGELTSVAVSRGGEWLVAGTRGNGVGIYELARRRWLAPPRESMPPAAPHVLWWADRFWIGGTAGVTELRITATAATFRAQPDITGEVLDLDAHPDAGLLALTRVRCATDPGGCLRLWRLEGPAAIATALISERDRFTGLNLDRLFYAQQWDQRLVVAGHNGIFVYDSRLRSWRRLVADAITTVEPCRGRRCFYFGIDNAVGLITPGSLEGEVIVRWRLPGERPTHVASGPSGDAIVLTAAGNAARLGPEATVVPVFSAVSATPISRFENAVPLGNAVLFYGTSGALWHDVVSRIYRPLPLAPAWLHSRDSILRASDTHLFALIRSDTAYTTAVIPAPAITQGNFGPFQTVEGRVEGPLRYVDKPDANGLRVIDAVGRVALITAQGNRNLTGSAEGMEGTAILDIAASSDRVAVLTARGVREYLPERRSWGEYLPAPPAETVAGLAARGAEWLGRSVSDRLMMLGATPSTVIGAGRLSIIDGGIRDVLVRGPDVYVAGTATIDRYSTQVRGVERTWPLPDGRGGAVRLETTINREPLSLSGDVARLGDRVLSGEVANLSYEAGHLWLVKGAPDRRYLEHQLVLAAPAPRQGAAAENAANALPQPQAPWCLFRFPAAGAATTALRDLRPRPGGLLAAATDAGLRVYSRQRRSWYATNLPADVGRGDLYAFGDALLMVDAAPSGLTLRVLRNEPGLPASCDVGVASFAATPEPLAAQAVAVDERGRRALALRPDGAVVEVTGDSANVVVAAADTGPRATDIIRSWYFPTLASNALWVATVADLWQYDVSRHQWTRLAVSLDGLGTLGAQIMLDLQPDRESIAIVARHPTGGLFTGRLPLGSATAGILLRRAVAAATPTIGAGADIVDVQQNGSSWIFLLNDTLKLFDPTRRVWRTALTATDGDRFLSRGRLGEAELISGVSRGGRPVWWVQSRSGDQPQYGRFEHAAGETVALVDRDRIYRLDSSARLHRCTLTRAAAWNCATETTPLALSPTDVSRTLAWRRVPQAPYEYIVMQTANELVVYGRGTGQIVRLPASGLGPITSLRHASNRLWIRAGSRVLSLDSSLRGANWHSASGVDVPATSGEPPTADPDITREIASWFVPVNGRWTFDPFTRFDETDQGVFAVRPSGAMRLGRSGGMEPRIEGVLDAGWLKWDRESSTFLVKTPTDVRRYTRDQFVQDGRLLFEEIGGLGVAGDRRHYANAAGIWEVHADFRLDHPDVRLHPAPVSSRGDSHSGWFRAGAVEYRVVNGRLVERPATATFRIGSVTFFKDVKNGLLAVLHDVNGGTATAYADSRFVWDTGRRAVSFARDGGVLLLSDAGVHAATSLSEFDPGPPGALTAHDRIGADADGRVRLLRGGQWYRRTAPGVWERVPPSRGPVVSDGIWEWTKSADGVAIVDVATRHAVSVTSGDAGVMFASDALVDAAAYGGQLFLATRDAVEIGRPDDRRSTFSAVQRLQTTGDGLRIFDSPGGQRLFLRQGARVRRWDGSLRGFVDIDRDSNPYERRTVEAGRLRFVVSGASVDPQLRLDDAGAQSSWVPIGLEHGRFPFDVVRAVAVVEGTVFVASAAGLQRYSGYDFSLDRARFVPVGSGSEVPIAAGVERIGIPCDAPQEVVACRPGNCFRRSSPDAFDLPVSTEALSCSIRARSGMWSWAARARELRGQYILAEATPGAARERIDAIDLSDGRFPHDEIEQIAGVGPYTVTVWRRNHVSVHAANTLNLNAGVRNAVFADAVRLIPVRQAVPISADSNVELPAGMYLQEGTRVWRLRGGDWRPVADANQIDAVLGVQQRQPLLQRKRLRLARDTSGNLIFEMRMPGSPWQPIPWDSASNRLSIDVWNHMRLAAGRLWVATPQGLIAYDSRGQLDPDAFRVIAPAPGEEGRRVTDLRIEGNQAQLRYDADSSRVYSLPLDERLGPPQFARTAGDPFAEQTFETDASVWTWKLIDRVGWSTGRLTALLKTEPVRFDNGRFDFDAVNSIAFFNGQLHYATDSRGWFESPVRSAALDHIRRPPQSAVNPLDVGRVESDGDATLPGLCLEQVTDGYVRMTHNGSVERTQGCATLLAAAGFWRYVRDGTALSISPTAGSGRSGERRLVDGRFSDDVVVGPPVAVAGADLLVPTSAGVSRLNKARAVVDVIPPPQDQAVPKALYVTSDGTVLHAARGRFEDLGGRPHQTEWSVNLPPGAEPERVEFGPDRLVRIEWSDASGRHHEVLDPQRPSVQSRDVVAFDVRQLRAYRLRSFNTTLDGWLRLLPGDRDGYLVKDPRVRMINFGSPVALLESFQHGSRGILIGSHDIFEVNLEWLTRAAAAVAK